ncbi:MAG: oxygen-insensitive NADPH nitroreductase [Phycisphaerales bacterium]|nr:oxygen-insensitive NADPH nitroreductase [Phycisphaerales bacterium]
MNDTIDLMMRHRSIRQFTDEPVSEDHVQQAVAAGQMASTSAAIQSYCVIRVQDMERRKTLVGLTGDQTKVARCGAFFVICGDVRRHRLIGQRDGMPYDTQCEAFLLAVVDATLFAQNMVLAFESMGYGICYIGGLRNNLADVSALLSMPEGLYPLFGLCVGRPAQDPMIRPRLPQQSVLFDDAYPDDDAMLAEIEAYDATMLDYFRQRGAGDRTWSVETASKFQQPRRVDIGPYYRRQGANLD